MKTLLVVGGLAAASLSFAQSSTFSAPTNMGVRLGYVLPIDTALKNNAASYIGVGLDFPVQFKLLAEGESILSIDWIGKSGGGAKGNIFPFMLNQRFYAKTNPGARRTYFFFGAGIALIDVGSSGTALAARTGYGSELGENLYGELSFLYSDAAGGARASSLGFHLGYRF